MPIGPNGEKRPSDPYANAVQGCKVLVGDTKEEYMDNRRKGGQKGGKTSAVTARQSARESGKR